MKKNQSWIDLSGALYKEILIEERRKAYQPKTKNYIPDYQI